MEDILQKIGLTVNEVAVYRELLKLGNRTAAEIARVLKLDKSSTYRACENLVKMGLLISSPKKRGTTYLAQNPEILQDIYQQQLRNFNGLGEQLTTTIQELQKSAQSSSRNVQMRIEYGLEGIRKAMTESLTSQEKLLREWQQTGKKYYYYPEQIEFILDFAAKRIKNKISIKQLESDLTFEGLRFEGIMATDPKLFKEMRLMPGDFNDKNTLRVWDDTVNIISFDENDEFVVVTIKDKYIALLIKNLFDFVWSKGQPYGKIPG